MGAMNEYHGKVWRVENLPAFFPWRSHKGDRVAWKECYENPPGTQYKRTALMGTLTIFWEYPTSWILLRAEFTSCIV